MIIGKTRVLLCDVQGLQSLENAEQLDKVLSAISEAYSASLRYSNLVSGSFPQQGFGDAVWWITNEDRLNWKKEVISYSVFATALLAASIELPFPLLAPAVFCEGTGAKIDLPWTYGLTKEKIQAISLEGVPVNWLYSTAMHDVWVYSNDPGWRPPQGDPAPMLVLTDEAENTLRHELAASFGVSDVEVILESYQKENKSKVAKAIRVVNCFELIVKLGLVMKTFEPNQLKQLANQSLQYSKSHIGQKGAEIQLSLAKVLDRFG